MRKISDRICEEHGLYVIETPGFGTGRTKEHQYKIPTKRSVFVDMIDEILATGKPKDFDDFLRQLAGAGCEIKRRGKTISVKPPKAKRFFRFRAGPKGLPDGYDEAAIRKRIADMQTDIKEEEKISAPSMPALPQPQQSQPPNTTGERKINLIIDLENSLKAKNSRGYQRWAQKFNLQQAAETLLFLQRNNLTDLEILAQTTRQARTPLTA